LTCLWRRSRNGLCAWACEIGLFQFPQTSDWRISHTSCFAMISTYFKDNWFRLDWFISCYIPATSISKPMIFNRWANCQMTFF
jgi:hypothetical protein